MIDFEMLAVERKDLKKVNEGLADLLDFIRDVEENSDEEDIYSAYFPSLIYLQHQEKCIKAARELFLMIEDDFVHYLQPFHQYVLYEMLVSAQDFFDDIQEEDAKDVPEIADEVDDENEPALENENLKDPDFYLDACFDDTDFLHVGSFFDAYKYNHSGFLKMGVNLGLYVDLMPDDIREEYLTLKRERSQMI